jgi:4-amino-4-deoxy-L-arabinose transferase-like glycosyltransferase
MEAVGRRGPERLALALVAALTALAAVLRFWGLGRQGFWYDEATTAWLLRAGPGRMLATLPRTESTPPLYYLLGWLWTRAFSDTELGLRSLSALAGVACVPVTFMAARHLTGRRAASFAALLVSVSPFLVWYSQEARAYSLYALSSAVSLWLFTRARARATGPRLAAWGVSAAAALCTHYFALFVVLPEALLLLADRRSPLRARLLALAIPAAAGGALVALALAQRGRTYFFTRAPLGVRVGQVVQFFAVGFSPPSTLGTLALAGALLACALTLLIVRAERSQRSGAAAAAFVGAVAVLVPVVLAAVGVDYLNARNVIGALPPLAVVAGAGFGAARPRLIGPALALALAGLSLWMVAGVARDLTAQRPHWQQVAALLAREPRRRAILPLDAPTWSRPLGFYLPRTWWAPAGGKPVREIDVVRKVPHTGPCPTAVWWGALCNIGTHRALQHGPARGFMFVSSERVAGFAVDRYAARAPIRVYPRRPFDRPGGAGRRLLLVTPTAAPVVP